MTTRIIAKQSCATQLSAKLFALTEHAVDGHVWHTKASGLIVLCALLLKCALFNKSVGSLQKNDVTEKYNK